jgi:hypothetical protein
MVFSTAGLLNFLFVSVVRTSGNAVSRALASELKMTPVAAKDAP